MSLANVLILAVDFAAVLLFFSFQKAFVFESFWKNYEIISP
jgi:hypothetical protein